MSLARALAEQGGEVLAVDTDRAHIDAIAPFVTDAVLMDAKDEQELASLAPWAWDPLVGRHAPGPSALRDFAEVVADGVARRVANAVGSGQKIETRTFDRSLAVRGDDADEDARGGDARTTTPRRETGRQRGRRDADG